MFTPTLYVVKILKITGLGIVSICAILACGSVQQSPEQWNEEVDLGVERAANPDSIKTIHLFVALCDNKYQGIVPVSQAIGNGQNPHTNLYWGAGYGVRTFFSKSAEWRLLKRSTIANEEMENAKILETLVFRHKSKPVYLLAHAYNGRHIKEAKVDFIEATSGRFHAEEKLPDGRILQFGGQSNLSAYIGHNGLMDFKINMLPAGDSSVTREAIILACFSKRYFSPYMQQSKASPILWTTHLMAPEAYVIHDALSKWCLGKSTEEIRTAAASAYAKYQKCGVNAARRLLVAE